MLLLLLFSIGKVGSNGEGNRKGDADSIGNGESTSTSNGNSNGNGDGSGKGDLDHGVERREKKARQRRAKQKQAVEAAGGRSVYEAIAEALRDRAEKRKLWLEREVDKVRETWGEDRALSTVSACYAVRLEARVLWWKKRGGVVVAGLTRSSEILV